MKWRAGPGRRPARNWHQADCDRVRSSRSWGIVISVLRARYGLGIARDLYKDVLSDRMADPAASVLMWSVSAEVAGGQWEHLIGE
jgi:hypothetical protein